MATICVAAGCSGSSDAARQAETCDTPGVSAGEVRLGLIYPDSGLIGDVLRAARSGVDARLKLANAEGGVNGRRVSYDWQNDEASVSANKVATAKLVSQGVFGFLEMTTAGSGGAELLRSQGIPAAGLPSERVWADPAYPNMFTFPSDLTSEHATDIIGRYVKAQGGTRAIIVRNDTEESSRGYGSLLERSVTSVGIPARVISFSSVISSPEQLAAQIRADGADAVLIAMGGDDIERVTAAAHSASSAIKTVIAVSGYGPDTIERYGRTVAGLAIFAAITPFEADIPAQKTYLGAMAQYSPEFQPPNDAVAYSSYIVTDLFLRGLAAAGPCPTREAFVKGLRAVKDYDADGLLAGPVDFSRSLDQQDSCFTFVRVNSAGTGYEIVQNEAPGSNPLRWCGKPLAS